MTFGNEDSFQLGGQNNSEIIPKRVRVVLPALEQSLGDLAKFQLTESISEINQLTIDDMSEEQIAAYLFDFLKKVKNNSETPDSLMSHTMFRGVLTRALQIE